VNTYHKHQSKGLYNEKNGGPAKTIWTWFDKSRAAVHGITAALAWLSVVEEGARGG